MCRAGSSGARALHSLTGTATPTASMIPRCSLQANARHSYALHRRPQVTCRVHAERSQLQPLSSLQEASQASAPSRDELAKFMLDLEAALPGMSCSQLACTIGEYPAYIQSSAPGALKQGTVR